MLLGEISRLEAIESISNDYKDKYHETDKQCAVLKEKEKSFLFSEILYSVSLTIGAAIIGLIPSIDSSDFPPFVFGILGGVLLIGAIIAKVVKK